jgi:osmotically-inducible protein OsmY
MSDENPAAMTFSSEMRTPGFARSACFLLCALLLSGCAAAVVGAGAAVVVATDRRSAGTVLDDQVREVQVHDRIYAAEEIDATDHVKVEVYQGTVLLVGEVKNEANRQLASRRASEVENVERVVNELVVAEDPGTLGKLDNTWLTTKVNTALMTENPMPGFDPMRIKVVSAGSKVYLMGLVSRAEGEAVAEVARNVSGVEKVVKVFSYMD